METKTDAEIADLATAVAEIGLTVTETLEAKSNELVDMVSQLPLAYLIKGDNFIKIHVEQ